MLQVSLKFLFILILAHIYNKDPKIVEESRAYQRLGFTEG